MLGGGGIPAVLEEGMNPPLFLGRGVSQLLSFLAYIVFCCHGPKAYVYIISQWAGTVMELVFMILD